MSRDSCDAIVVGAGPGGSTAAMTMARQGLRVRLLEKATFPRDKVCGDAVSGRSTAVLRRLGLHENLEALDFEPVRSVAFGSPDGDVVRIGFGTNAPEGENDRREDLKAFVSRREVFDARLAAAAADAGAYLSERTTVLGLIRSGGAVAGVVVREGGRTAEVRAPVVVGADGAYSVVARDLGMVQLAPRHYVAGVRAYYEGIEPHGSPDCIEMHFMEELLPGYFWIFPLPGRAANVGIGMLSAVVKRRRVNLRSMFEAMIDHPRFRSRFSKASRIGGLRGWGLPLGSRTRRMAGDGWMLIGDAASLIDPFTGEGIGNAMVSGELAAGWIEAAHETGSFGSASLRAFESDVKRTLGRELRISHALQRMLRWNGLVNLVVRKASRSEEIAEAISGMFEDVGQRKGLFSPGFYLRVLTA